MALFVLLLALGLIFRDPYVALRDTLRAKIVGAAETIVNDIQTSRLSLKMPPLTLGANSEELTGSGEQLDNLDGQAPTNTGSSLQFDSRLYPYRAMLNETAQKVYNQVYENALKLNADRFTLVTPVTEEALCDIMNAVYNDHPELFWVDTAYSYGFLHTGSVVTMTLSFNDTVESIERAQEEFDRAVRLIVEAAQALGSDVDKEKYVHDYLVNRVSYSTAAAMNQSAYSALVGDASVCAGFSRAFQHVLMQLQIPCYYSTGTAAGGDHAWNIVTLDGEYYNVDVAWDDATAQAYGQKDYSYFNLPDSVFSKDHTRSAISARLPACTGTAMTYAAVYGRSDSTDSSAAAGSLATYADRGFSKTDIIKSMDGYNAYCRDQLIAKGPGSHTLKMVLKNVSLMHEVYAAAEDESYVSGYAQAVVNALHLQNCSIALELSGETLADGYILLTQKITLKGDQPPAGTVTNTPAQTPENTTEPTLPPTEAPLITPPPAATTIPTEAVAASTAVPLTTPPPAAQEPWAIPDTPEQRPPAGNDFDAQVEF